MPGGQAVCRHTQGGGGGSDRQHKGQRQPAVLPELELERRMPSLHVQQERPAGRCRWP